MSERRFEESGGHAEPYRYGAGWSCRHREGWRAIKRTKLAALRFLRGSGTGGWRPKRGGGVETNEKGATR